MEAFKLVSIVDLRITQKGRFYRMKKIMRHWIFLYRAMNKMELISAKRRANAQSS